METKNNEEKYRSEAQDSVYLENKKKEDQKPRSLWQKIKKGLLVLVVILIGLASGADLGNYVYLKYAEYKNQKEYEKAVDEITKMYQEDTFGGNTPEETIDLFIEALKKGDMELASKYFVLEEQKKWEETLRDMKNAGRGRGLIDELEIAKQNWRKEEKDTNTMIIKYNTGEGEEEITNFISLTKNINNKWKIKNF